ncbi:MAG: sigma-70 family RNA polymerase sigma factor [Planctomycetota bacterium]
MHRDRHDHGEILLDPASLAAHDRSLRRLAQSLTRDPALADDLVQDTWIAALAAREQPRSAIGWLRTALRRLAAKAVRARIRRARREDSMKRPESAPAVAEALDREAERRRVVDALVGLPEPYRSALILRFLEELEPGEIATRLHEPVETVRTRIRRGLDMLRARLQGRFHTLALCALDRLLLGLGSLSVLTMATKSKILVAATLVILFTGGSLWLAQAGASPSDRDASRRPADPAVATVVEKPSSPSARDSHAEGRSALEIGDTREPARGATVVIDVVWSDDTPAIDMEIELRSSTAEGEFDGADARHARTDAQGRVRFEDLHQRNFTAIADGRCGAGRSVEVGGPGSVTTLRWQMPRGAVVRGRVVDTRGQPVADAEILVASWAGDGRTWRVARSDPDGRFRVPDVGQAVYVGARHPRFVPSPMQSSFAKPGGEIGIELRLGDGPATVTGTVRGPDGAVVAGAKVHGSIHRNSPTFPLPDGSFGMPPAQARAVSDGAGRFELSPLLPGKRTVWVQVDGFALWYLALDIEVAGTRDLDVRMDLGSRLLGTVRDASGHGVPGIRVAAIAGELDAGESTTDADGGYVIEHLPIGRLSARIYQEGRIVDFRDLEIRASSDTRYDFDFPAPRKLRGRIVDARGQPASHCNVDAAGSTWSGRARSDEDGRFSIDAVTANSVRLIVEQAGYAIAERHVDLDRDETDVLITLDIETGEGASIFGRVVDRDGHSVIGATVMPHRDGPITSTTIHPVDSDGGRFRLERCPPGRYRIRIEARGFGTAFRSVLVGKDDQDLGTIVMEPPGFVSVRIDDAEARTTARTRVSIRSSDGVNAGAVRLDRGVGTSEPLASGRYHVVVRDAELANEAFEVEVTSGRTSEMVLARHPGVRVHLVLPKDSSGPITLRDERGVHLDAVFPTRAESGRVELSLRPGRYQLVPLTGSPHAFTVPESGTEITVDVPSW